MTNKKTASRKPESIHGHVKLTWYIRISADTIDLLAELVIQSTQLIMQSIDWVSDLAGLQPRIFLPSR